MKRIILLLFILLLYPTRDLLFAQSDSTRGSFAIEVKAGYGFIIAHRPALVPLQQHHVREMEIAVVWPAIGTKKWEQTFLYPEKGINIALFDLGNEKKLGKGIAVYPYLNFPLNKRSDWQLFFRYGMGLGYVQKDFDRMDNYQNAAIGSHLNGVIHFDLHYYKNVGTAGRLDLGAGLTHYSNGSTTIPNLGINIATAHVGYSPAFGKPRVLIHTTPESFHPSNSIQVYLAGAIKKIYPPLGDHYYAGTLSAVRLRQETRKSAWGLGADLFYDESLGERLRRDAKIEPKPIDDFRPGIYGAYQLSAGNVGLMFNMGFYFYTKWKGDGNFYHRICLRYYFHDLFLCMNLKTHYAKADFIEWGCGWKF